MYFLPLPTPARLGPRRCYLALRHSSSTRFISFFVEGSKQATSNVMITFSELQKITYSESGLRYHYLKTERESLPKLCDSQLPMTWGDGTHTPRFSANPNCQSKICKDPHFNLRSDLAFDWPVIFGPTTSSAKQRLPGSTQRI